MQDRVSDHYSGRGNLAKKLVNDLREIGLEPTELKPSDFESIDEFHFRGREASLELLKQLNFQSISKVLDI